MQTISRLILNSLDQLIATHHLHDGRWPVSVAPLLENYSISYQAMPDCMEAIAVRQRRLGYIGMLSHSELKEVRKGSWKRHAQAHEIDHILLKGRPLWVIDEGFRHPGAFEAVMDGIQERQCDMVAAYLLVPRKAPREMRWISSQLSSP